MTESSEQQEWDQAVMWHPAGNEPGPFWTWKGWAGGDKEMGIFVGSTLLFQRQPFLCRQYSLACVVMVQACV